MGSWEWEVGYRRKTARLIPHSPFPIPHSPASQFRVFRDDLFHDFRSARADGVQPGVAPRASDRIFGRISEAAHNLHAVVHHPLIQLAAEELGHGDLAHAL